MNTTDAACEHKWVRVMGVWGELVGYTCWLCCKWWEWTAMKPPGVDAQRLSRAAKEDGR